MTCYIVLLSDCTDIQDVLLSDRYTAHFEQFPAVGSVGGEIDVFLSWDRVGVLFN